MIHAILVFVFCFFDKLLSSRFAVTVLGKVFCLGRVWTNYDEARWRGVRDQAHERLYELLQDRHPEVSTANTSSCLFYMVEVLNKLCS